MTQAFLLATVHPDGSVEIRANGEFVMNVNKSNVPTQLLNMDDLSVFATFQAVSRIFRSIICRITACFKIYATLSPRTCRSSGKEHFSKQPFL